jgi:hypothetical protein
MDTIQHFQESVFDSIDIEHVFWVDDFFSGQVVDVNIEEQFRLIVQSKYELGETEQLASLAELSHLDFSDPVEIILANLPSNPSVLERLVRELGFESTFSDLNSETFNSFMEVLQRRLNVRSMSLRDWSAHKTELLQNNKVLFFVDLDLSRDGGATDEGKYIIQEILRANNESHYCVLFTHNCQHGEDEERQRLEVIDGFAPDVPHHTFSVFSKSVFSRDTQLPIEFTLPEMLRRVFVRKLGNHLAKLISEEMKRSVDQIVDQLNQCSFYELDASIFNSALSEGGSEFELIHRLYSLQQSLAIKMLVQSKPVAITELVKLRKLQKIRFEPSDPNQREYFLYFKHLFKSSEFFVGLRSNEIWTSGDLINKIHSPLSIGDTFNIKLDGEIEKEYILIEQSCDLMVRKDGTRKLNEGLLVPFERATNVNDGKFSDSKFHVFHIPGRPKDAWIFDFSKGFNVNLNLLDLCVFNEDGKAKLDVGSKSCLEYIFLSGWIERFNNLFSKFASDDGELKPRSEVCGTVSNFMLDASKGIGIHFSTDNKVLSVDVQRSSRLNSPFVNILLQRLYAHKTRIPLEHDFSHIAP